MTPKVELSQESKNVILNVQGVRRKDVKKEIKAQIGNLLKNGSITKEEAKTALKFSDKDLQKALTARNRYECGGNFTKSDEKLLNKYNLSISDLYDVAHLAGSDFTVNTAKLSKEEKVAGKNGEQTRSELINITNALNEKIKANGGTKMLSERQTLSLMRSIGLGNGAYKAGIGAKIPGVNAVLGIIESVSGVHTVSKTIEEKAFGAQTSNPDGSVTNKTEQKMLDWES